MADFSVVDLLLWLFSVICSGGGVSSLSEGCIARSKSIPGGLSERMPLSHGDRGRLCSASAARMFAAVCSNNPSASFVWGSCDVLPRVLTGGGIRVCLVATLAPKLLPCLSLLSWKSSAWRSSLRSALGTLVARRSPPLGVLLSVGCLLLR
ncbi:hypothetical protein Rs2_12371 [Raphanus sativus]|nr:hypothetical protein Rs2_12371 [Raphanus sativus]